MNNYPDDFNISSDYATISGKEKGTTQLVLPKGLSIAGGAYYIQTQQSHIVGNGMIRLLISNSTNPDRAITAAKVSVTRTFITASGDTTPIVIIISAWRESKNKVVCALSMFNPYDIAIINQNATETFYVDVRTMTFPY